MVGVRDGERKLRCFVVKFDDQKEEVEIRRKDELLAGTSLRCAA
jgi:hypothetical protein